MNIQYQYIIIDINNWYCLILIDSFSLPVGLDKVLQGSGAKCVGWGLGAIPPVRSLQISLLFPLGQWDDRLDTLRPSLSPLMRLLAGDGRDDSSITEVVEHLRGGWASGVDEVPPEFLKVWMVQCFLCWHAEKDVEDPCNSFKLFLHAVEKPKRLLLTYNLYLVHLPYPTLIVKVLKLLHQSL